MSPVPTEMPAADGTCTPGAPGTMIRAGKPWSIERSTPFTFNASRASESAT